MSETLAVILTVAVGLIAVVQVGLIVIALWAIRRAQVEMAALSNALLTAVQQVEQTAAEVGELTADVRETIGHARQAVANVGAVVGAGRSLIEGALGSALLRRFGLGRGRLGGAAAAGVTQALISAAVAVYKAVQARRAGPPTQAAAGAPAGGRAAAPAPGSQAQRTPLRAGWARRIASREVSMQVPPLPPVVGGGPGIGA